MSVIDHKRLTNEVFKLDIERMRQGWYTDKYFVNISAMLIALDNEGYHFRGETPLPMSEYDLSKLDPGNLEVEMQWFTRHPGRTLIVGVDKALTMLKTCTGYYKDGEFINTADRLEVWAVEDGDFVHYNGNPAEVQPVLRVRGRYRDFAILETPTLGILTRASRVATNVYETLVAANGKSVMFFPARFDLHEVQAADGYSYQIAVQRFNLDYTEKVGALVSTDAQGDWWGGAGGGTVAHAAIACFMGDTAQAMLAFAHTIDASIMRIALVDFNNDCVADSLKTCKAMFFKYKELMESGNESEARKYILNGVRLDTSASLRDASVDMLGDITLDHGVNQRLVVNVRRALDTAWECWDLPDEWKPRAEQYCRNVRIVVSGGFNVDRITKFEKQGVPVDTYAVGSAFFENSGVTKMDFTADVVRIKIDGKWVDMAKIGRKACDNPALKRVW